MEGPIHRHKRMTPGPVYYEKVKRFIVGGNLLVWSSLGSLFYGVVGRVAAHLNSNRGGLLCITSVTPVFRLLTNGVEVRTVRVAVSNMHVW